MVEVSKCSSQKVRGGGLSAYFDRSSNKTTIGPQSRANGPDEICLSFSRFAISQPILMVEVSKCSSRKVRGGGKNTNICVRQSIEHILGTIASFSKTSHCKT